MAFHSAITGCPCSVDSRLTVPVASWNSRPSAGDSPADGPSARAGSGHVPRITSPSARRQPDAGQHAVGALSHLRG